MSTPRADNVEKVVAAIKFKPMTIPLISMLTGVSKPTIHRVLEDLRTKGECHITGYEIRDKSYARVAIYKSGPGVDAERPDRMTKQEYNRRAKAAMRESKYRDAEARRRERIRLENERPAFRHPMDIVFFGPPARLTGTSTPIAGRVFQQSMRVTADELEEV